MPAPNPAGGEPMLAGPGNGGYAVSGRGVTARNAASGEPMPAWVERFDRRGNEPFELFTSEFVQNSFKIQYISLENSKMSEIFNIF